MAEAGDDATSRQWERWEAAFKENRPGDAECAKFDVKTEGNELREILSSS